MKYRVFFFFILGASFLVLFSEMGCQTDIDQQENRDPEALFTYEIQPILESKCLSCHGNDPEKIEGDIDLRSQQKMLASTSTDHPIIIPNQPTKSRLYKAVKRINPDLAMPPKDGDRLTEEEVQLFYNWIKAGAPWPDENRQKEILATVEWNFKGRMPVNTGSGQSEAWNKRMYQEEDLWAYFPIEKVEVPEEALPKHGGHPIDAFIHQKLQEEGLSPAPLADKRQLIRRATFDLIGLPPSEKEITDFLADDSPDAFTKVVDRLLASPHYGEQWGRHWLDVVRYADSGGFSNDYIRPTAWRYRDYVIRSFNEDKPYNQFVIEQIAGDELNPNDPEMLIAAGFLRMGPWEHTGMAVAAETRQFFLDDVTNSVGETFLATPLNCAKCHDHKYDPISAKDYYQIQAVFATTQFADRPATFLASENVELPNFEQQRILDWIDSTKMEHKKIVDKEENAAKQWFKERGLKYIPKKQRRKLPDNQQPPRYLGLTNQELGYRKLLNKRTQTITQILRRFEPLAFSVYNGPTRVLHSQQKLSVPENLEGEPQAIFVLDGGSVYAPKEMVEPGVMSVVDYFQQPIDGANKPKSTNPIPSTFEGRRLAFAKWLTQPTHPITARAMVNRIWQYHFGEGIVGTPNNFGKTGKKPTHPELLNWLTQHFMDNGWSIKSLHRLIMASEAYQRSGTHPQQEKLDLLDPENKYLAKFSPRRLEAEEIRDALLFYSGELNLELGGFPIRPEINQEVALQPRHIMGSIAPAYQPSRTPEERNRRSIYAERYRTLADPMMEVFNQPGTDLSCERRTESTVTPQVFALFNSLNTRDRAINMATKLQEEFQGEEDQIQQIASLVWNRAPTEKEFKNAQAYLEKMKKYHHDNPAPKEEYPKEVLREMFEEMTGESFEFTEKLDIYHDYVPDLKPKDVSAETRALADLAVVFFNTNEFIYVY